MGIHLCQFCVDEGFPEREVRFNSGSSCDVTLIFRRKDGTVVKWTFPWVGIAHYIEVHFFLPIREFIRDVMESELIGGQFLQTKGIGETVHSDPSEIGYLTEPGFPTGEVPEGFLDQLEKLVEIVEKSHYGF